MSINYKSSGACTCLVKMPYRDPHPPAFFRVTDNSSRSQLGEHGFIASDPLFQPDMFPPWSELQRADLKRMLDKHLDWPNREPTPFISVYISARVAWEYARARKRDGWTGVTISYIRRDMIESACLWRVRALAKDLGYWITARAWQNSDFERIILNHIPKEAIFDQRFLN